MMVFLNYRNIFLGMALSISALGFAFPSYEEVKSGYQSAYSELLDKNGVYLQGVRVDMQHNRLDWALLSELSPAIPEAFMFAEDREFYSHRGIDWSAIAAASLKLIKGDKSRGASTITMQLAGLLDAELSWRSGGRSLSQKWNQMQAARELEATWTKDHILEAWLNLVAFRGDIQGINAASQAFFAKKPRGLNRNEALLLAAQLPSPNATAATIANRACSLIAAGFLQANCQEVRDLAQLHLNRRLSPYPENPALMSLASQLLLKPNQKLITTLSQTVQKNAQEILMNQLKQLEKKHVNGGAVLVLDNTTGAVLAYVANVGLVDSARLVDAIKAPRQAGSTLKPFLYEQAIEKKYLTAASIVEDSEINLNTPNGLYVPQNYEKDFKGPVTVRTSLAGSLNVPAVRTLNIVGVENFWLRLREVGLSTLTESPEFYGYSLALGSADVSLLSLTNAYRVLAHDGYFSPVAYLKEQFPSAPLPRVMNPEAAFIVNDILSDRGARAITFGLDNPLSTPFWTAVKTGTSKDMRDNWCIGFSKNYTVGVWVGNLNGEPMQNVSGVTGAAPVWSAVMRVLERGKVRPDGDLPVAPLTLKKEEVSFSGFDEPKRTEWFIAGTEMSHVEYLPSNSNHIIYPVNETIIALDPDIPAEQQKVRISAEVMFKDFEWHLDGQKYPNQKQWDWSPTVGQHTLLLSNKQGAVLDKSTFSVRGSLKPVKK